MKNIHILPTDKPDFVIFKNRHLGDRLFHWNMDLGNPMNRLNYVGQNIYITNNEEIKKGDWVYCLTENRVLISNVSYSTLDDRFKIILTTDQDLIKDSVQAIDDEFLEWFVKNPNCEKVKVEPIYYASGYNLNIPKEEPK